MLAKDAEERRLARAAVEAALAAGAVYADTRWVRLTQERLTVKNGRLEALTSSQEAGFGVRVIARGAWGFAATTQKTLAAVVAVARQAVEVARAGAALQAEPVELTPMPAVVADWASPCQEDPFAVPPQERLAYLLEVDACLRRSPQVRVSEAFIEAGREEKLFVSSEGTEISQEKVITGAGCAATAVADGEVQRRSYPNLEGDYAGRGYEFVREMDLLGQAPRVREEAVALLQAPVCPEGIYDVILGGAQLALQVHESCGHPVELDRVLGTELSLAGGSFLTLEKRGSFRYGAPVVNLTADATLPGGLGSFAYDDEGVPAQRVPLVREGIFVDYLSSRETARVLGGRSNGAMRADAWNRLPLIRMTNINLEPGPWRLADLIRDTERGLLLETTKSWSIDDLRLNFQFGTEIAYRIEHGEVTGIYKNPVYTGITPEFWAACDAVCGGEDWRVWGIANCGKGEPMQIAQVGHGVAPARFRRVQVGGVQ